jgi:hypothetical protein
MRRSAVRLIAIGAARTEESRNLNVLSKSNSEN